MLSDRLSRQTRLDITPPAADAALLPFDVTLSTDVVANTFKHTVIKLNETKT